jgi:uncharacterized membrane protein
MTLALTPNALAGAYEYLRTTPPIKGWKLPHADDVEFHVTRHRDREADHEVRRRRDHIIRVSARKVRTTDALMQAMAHEMIHAYQDAIARTDTRADHNRDFKWLARSVCRAHGWDKDEFIK